MQSVLRFDNKCINISIMVIILLKLGYTPALKSWIAQKKSILWIQLIPDKWGFLSNYLKLQKKWPGHFGEIWKNLIPFKFLKIMLFFGYISKEY